MTQTTEEKQYSEAFYEALEALKWIGNTQTTETVQ